MKKKIVDLTPEDQQRIDAIKKARNISTDIGAIRYALETLANSPNVLSKEQIEARLQELDRERLQMQSALAATA